ncbi:TRAP transporter small permease [Nitratireductor sp. GCM10026969]|uniref:TRAP transporter small permease n=1 Tax=Nitratireductor sp. GCM10026969 TaxID=3252645 RepID=UPI00361718DC
MQAALRWLQARADNMAVGFLTVMFLSFILQIVSRYVLNHPLGWTLELCLTMWLWVVFWGSAFLLTDQDHVRFDMLYLTGNVRVRRVLALVSAVAILVGFAAALPATFDYITFYKIKKSATLHIRLDYVFSVYGIFAVAVIARYALRAWQIARGDAPDEPQEPEPR